jgi:hypothetical protein
MGSPLDGLGRHALETLLDDYERMQKNSFYRLFIESLREELENRLNDLGNLNLEEKAIRALQGKVELIKILYSRPERMVREIQSKLTGESHTRPQ